MNVNVNMDVDDDVRVALGEGEGTEASVTGYIFLDVAPGEGMTADLVVPRPRE